MIGSFDWGHSNNHSEYMDHHFFPIPTEKGMTWKRDDFSVQMKDRYFKSIIAKIKIQRQYYIEQVQESLSGTKRVLK